MTVAQQTLLKGAVKSFVAGSTGIIVSLNLVDPDHFNAATLGGWRHLGLAILIAGIFAEARFLNQWAHSGDGVE